MQAIDLQSGVCLTFSLPFGLRDYLCGTMNQIRFEGRNAQFFQLCAVGLTDILQKIISSNLAIGNCIARR